MIPHLSDETIEEMFSSTSVVEILERIELSLIRIERLAAGQMLLTDSTDITGNSE